MLVTKLVQYLIYIRTNTHAHSHTHQDPRGPALPWGSKTTSKLGTWGGSSNPPRFCRVYGGEAVVVWYLSNF